MRSGRARAYIRGAAAKIWGDTGGTPQANNRGELCVVQALPPESELVRLGNSYGNRRGVPFAGINTPIPPLDFAILWNGENSNGKSYIVSEVQAQVFGSSGAGVILTLCAEMSHIVPLKTPGISSTVGTFSLCGSTNYRGKANISTKSSGFSPNTDWHRIGTSLIIANTNNAAGLRYNVYGRYIVPPQGQFSFGLISNVATGIGVSYNLIVFFHEVQLPLR